MNDLQKRILDARNLIESHIGGHRLAEQKERELDSQAYHDGVARELETVFHLLSNLFALLDNPDVKTKEALEIVDSHAYLDPQTGFYCVSPKDLAAIRAALVGLSVENKELQKERDILKEQIKAAIQDGKIFITNEKQDKLFVLAKKEPINE